jgi:uncharacterized protein YecE (DUF72 family)
MPNAADIAKILAECREKLTFSIKAHKTLKHEVNLSLWEGDANTFLMAIKPMIGTKRFETVLFQFLNSFYKIHIKNTCAERCDAYIHIFDPGNADPLKKRLN